MKKCTTIILSFLFIISASGLHAAGTYANGWLVIKKLVKFESGGLLIESWEGVATVHSYKKDETCDEKKYLCYTVVDEQLKFSVRPENAKTVNFLRKKVDKGGFVVKFQHHRIEPLGLSTDFEVLAALERSPEPSASLPTKKVVDKTGSRNFSLQGDILRLDYRGTAVGTYEGLYLDLKTGKVHPFSVTHEEMAKHIWKVMKSAKPVFIGVSVSLVKAVRLSDHDIFEINYLEEAGSVTVPKTDKPTDKPAGN